MTDEQAALLVERIGQLAGAMSSIAKTLELDYQRRYPPRKEPRDVDITKIPTDEEKLIEDQGGTGEPTVDQWTSLGPRERAFEEKKKNRNPG